MIRLASTTYTDCAWYCPQIPQPLIDVTLAYRVNKSIDETTWHSRTYLLRPKEKADAGGTTDYRDPRRPRT